MVTIRSVTALSQHCGSKNSTNPIKLGLKCDAEMEIKAFACVIFPHRLEKPFKCDAEMGLAVLLTNSKVQLIIPDEQPCFDLTQISTLISHLCAGLFSSISLLFA